MTVRRLKTYEWQCDNYFWEHPNVTFKNPVRCPNTAVTKSAYGVLLPVGWEYADAAPDRREPDILCTSCAIQRSRQE